MPPPPVAPRPDPDHPALRSTPTRPRRRRRWRRRSRQGGFAPFAARRRHRLRQDRGLFRGGGRGAAAGPAGADPACRRSRSPAGFLDRFAGRFGVAAGGVAFRGRRRARRERTWRGVAAGEARVVVGARSALFLPFRRPRPDRRRRGARPRLQAGGRRRLPRPRHGGGARPASPASPVVLASATPVDREPRQRPPGRYAPPARCRAATAGAALPAIAAIDMRAGSRPSAAAGSSPPLVAAIDGDARARGSRRCCSSTAAATRR